MIRIKKVTPKEAYRLDVQLENGNCITLDFSRRLHTVRFGMLSDKKFFQSAITDGDFIRWGNKIEISSSEVFSWRRNINCKEG